MARHHRFEGSREDKAADRRGAKKAGMSQKEYEGSARDRAEDAAGEGKIKVREHERTRRPPPPPMPPPVMPSGDMQRGEPPGQASPVGLAPGIGGKMEGL